MGDHQSDPDFRHGRALRDGVEAEQHPIRLERVARHGREQKAAAPADQLPDRGLNFPADLRQLVHLRIDRRRQGGPPHDIAFDQGGEARRQQGGAHAVKMIQEIAKSLRTEKKLPDDQECPALADDFRRAGKCAELRVVKVAHVSRLVSSASSSVGERDQRANEGELQNRERGFEQHEIRHRNHHILGSDRERGE